MIPTRRLSLRSKVHPVEHSVYKKMQDLIDQQASRSNVLIIAGTVVALALIKWRFHIKSNEILQTHLSEYSKEAKTIMKETHSALTKMDGMWSQHAKLKEEHIRQLQSQNIQQNRSIDRLSAALKKCT